MSLGEAFIEVRADMRPFVRDLDRQVKVALERVEKATADAFGTTFVKAAGDAGDKGGRAAGDRFNTGLKNSMFGSDSHGLFVTIASSLASALDDGISALPTEVKAAIVGGALLAAPTLGAILGAAVATGLGLAVAGIGVLLAAQFEEVRERASLFGEEVRNLLSVSAQSFGPVVIDALTMIQNKIESLLPVLERIFGAASKFIEPLTAGLLAGLEAFVNALDEAIPNLQPFIETFSLGLQSTLEVVSEGLRRLASTGEAGTQALEDLFLIVNSLIGAFFGFIELLTFVNQLFHQLLNIAQEMSPLLALIVGLIRKEIPSAEGALIVSNFEATDSFEGLVAATKEEEKAAKALIKSMEGLVDAMYENIQVDIDFERSLDRITESLEENGKTLDIHKEKGRQNVESFISGLKDAEARALNRLQVQGYTTQQASALYNEEIAQLRRLGKEAGISDAEFDVLFADIIAVSQLRLNSDAMGVTGLSAGLDDATASALALLNMIRAISSAVISGAVGGIHVGGFADGDIVNRPTLGVFGEAGPEVIIPLTKPARAAELAQKSGLTAMLGSNGSVVMVFIGEEQLETRMVRVVERSNASQAMSLTQGPRRF